MNIIAIQVGVYFFWTTQISNFGEDLHEHIAVI